MVSRSPAPGVFKNGLHDPAEIRIHVGHLSPLGIIPGGEKHRIVRICSKATTQRAADQERELSNLHVAANDLDDTVGEFILRIGARENELSSLDQPIDRRALRFISVKSARPRRSASHTPCAGADGKTKQQAPNDHVRHAALWAGPFIQPATTGGKPPRGWPQSAAFQKRQHHTKPLDSKASPARATTPPAARTRAAVHSPTATMAAICSQPWPGWVRQLKPLPATPADPRADDCIVTFHDLDHAGPFCCAIGRRNTRPYCMIVTRQWIRSSSGG
jgi:hypothetical protein